MTPDDFARDVIIAFGIGLLAILFGSMLWATVIQQQRGERKQDMRRLLKGRNAHKRN